VDLLFLGSGNAYAAEGRAFSSFLLDGHHLFDAGPTILQQLKRSRVSLDQIRGVFISHFHGDHFLGLPFLFLDSWNEGRTDDLWIAGPPGIEERAEQLMELAFPELPSRNTYRRHYLEVDDGLEGELAGMPFVAAEVEHVPNLRCFAFRVQTESGTVMYSGDTTLCEGLLRLVPGSDVLVVECACGDEAVHMCPEDVHEIRRHASPGAKIIVTHLEGSPGEDLAGFWIAADLAHYRF
jgi:ribonuclease BN (tRNA processing enzyme)